MHAVEPLQSVHQEHSAIKQQLNFKRPVNAIDVPNPEQPVQHCHVRERRAGTHQLAGQTEQMTNRKCQKNRCPVGWKQAAEPRYHKIQGSCRLFQRHENNEATDDEK